DDDAHAFAVGLVADVGDALELFELHEFGDMGDEPRLVHLVGDFGDDDVLAVLRFLLDGGLGAHGKGAPAGLVGLGDALAPADVAPGGKIGAGNDFHHFLERGVGLFHQQDGGVHHLAQIVRRDVGGHAHGDAARAVDQQIGDARGEDGGLGGALVEVGDEIYGFFLDVGEHFFRDARQARFRVPHGRGRVAVHRAEVALAVHQRVAHVERLGHAHQRVVDGRVAVRMEFSEDFADDLGAFAVGLAGGEAQLVHAVEDAAMDGLQAVAHVGQGAPDDHAHGVVEVRFAHLDFDVYRNHYRSVFLIRHVAYS